MNRALLVFRKELREMFRDKRVISGAFIMPIFIMMAMIMLFGFLEKTLRAPETGKKGLGYVMVGGHSAVIDQMMGPKGLNAKLVPYEAEGQKLVREGKLRAVAVIPEDFDTKLVQGGVKVKLLYDPAETTSEISRRVVESAFVQLNKTKVEATLEAAGLPKSMVEPVLVEPVETTSAKGMGSSMIAGLLPYMIVLWAFYGGMSIVSDLVAGEKERGTLETILISPVHRSQIALGKFFALSMVCFASSMTTLVGIYMTGAMNLPLTRGMFPGGMSISPMSLLTIFAVLIPLVLSFAGVLLVVSAAAKNMREAQTFLTLVSFIVLIPAMFSQFVGMTDVGKERWVSFTPVLNSATSLRQALLGKIDPVTVFATITISIVIAAVMIRLVVWQFGREQILART